MIITGSSCSKHRNAGGHWTKYLGWLQLLPPGRWVFRARAGRVGGPLLQESRQYYSKQATISPFRKSATKIKKPDRQPRDGLEKCWRLMPGGRWKNKSAVGAKEAGRRVGQGRPSFAADVPRAENPALSSSSPLSITQHTASKTEHRNSHNSPHPSCSPSASP